MKKKNLLIAIGTPAYAMKSVEFFIDSNHNGQLDANDQKVNVQYTQK